MQAFYDSKPSKFEAVGNGSYLYRYNIKEVVPEMTEENSGNEHTSQWTCEEVTVWSPVSNDKITKAVIDDKWDSDKEQKLINEYNATEFGLYGAKTSDEAKAKIAAYKAFLEDRAKLKQQVDRDCAELGIK